MNSTHSSEQKAGRVLSVDVLAIQYGLFSLLSNVFYFQNALYIAKYLKTFSRGDDTFE